MLEMLLLLMLLLEHFLVWHYCSMWVLPTIISCGMVVGSCSSLVVVGLVHFMGDNKVVLLQEVLREAQLFYLFIDGLDTCRKLH